MDAMELKKEKTGIYERMFVLLFRQLDRDKIAPAEFVENFLKSHQRMRAYR